MPALEKDRAAFIVAETQVVAAVALTVGKGQLVHDELSARRIDPTGHLLAIRNN